MGLHRHSRHVARRRRRRAIFAWRSLQARRARDLRALASYADRPGHSSSHILREARRVRMARRAIRRLAERAAPWDQARRKRLPPPAPRRTLRDRAFAPARAPRAGTWRTRARHPTDRFDPRWR